MTFGGSSGGPTGMNVGTLTATYKIDASQGMSQIGTIMQSAAQIKNAFGNVQIKLDTGSFQQEMRGLITSTADYKNAMADAARALADLRAQNAANAALMGQTRTQNLANAQAIGQVRQQQLATAEATNIYNQAIKDVALNTAHSRDSMARYNEESARMRQEMVQMRLAAMQAAAAVQQQANGHMSLVQWLQQSTLAGAAFRAGEDLLQAAIRGVHAAIEDTIGAGIQYQQMLQQIQANTTLTGADMKQLDADVKQVGASGPANMDQFAQGMRIAASEGYSVADANKIATAAMMSAIATGANEKDTINELATVMHIFKINTDASTQSMDLLHQASALGKTTLEEFVSGTQRAMSVAANYGVTLRDAVGVLADFTRNGYTATQAGTQFVGLLTHIADPSTSAREELLRLSKATGVDLVADFSHAGLASKGLSGVLADMQTVIQKTGDESIISKLIPALRGAQGGYVALGNGAQDLTDIFGNLDTIINDHASPTLTGYQNAAQTTAFKVETLKNQFHVFALEIAQFLLPAINFAVEGMQRLLKAVGVDFQVPGFDAAGQAAKDYTSSVTTATNNTKDLNTAANEDKAQKLIAASTSMDQYTAQAKEATAAVNTLTAAGDDLKAQMDRVTEDMKNVTDKYKGLIDPLQQSLDAINQVSPDEHARALAELNIQQQEITLKLNAPDTSAYTETIDNLKQQVADLGEAQTGALDTELENLRQKLDDMGTANTDAVDAKISELRDKMQDLGKISTVDLDNQITALRQQADALGNTKDLDRQIQDLQAQLNQPAQSTAAQEGGMASLTAGLAAGTVSQGAFDAQYGALARQKQAITENNTLAKTALQQEIADLETKRTAQQRIDEDAKTALDARIKSLENEKASQEQANTVQKDALQEQIDAQTKIRDGIIKTHDADRAAIELQIKNDERQRKGIVDTYDATKKGLENQIAAQERAKSLATAEYDQKMKVLTSEMDHNKLLDDAAKIHRDILSYPLKQQIDDYKAAEQNALLPLQQHKDQIQALIDKNREDVATWREKEAAIKANEQAAKDLMAQLSNNPSGVPGEGPENQPGGPAIPGAIAPNELRGQRAVVGAAGGASGTFTKPQWMNDLVDFIEHTLWPDIDSIWTHLQSLYTTISTNTTLLDWKTNLDNVTQTINAVLTTIDLFYNAVQGNWKKAWDDFQKIMEGGTSSSKGTYSQFTSDFKNATDTSGTQNTSAWQKFWGDLVESTTFQTKATYDVYDEFGNKLGKATQTHTGSWLTDWNVFGDRIKTFVNGPLAVVIGPAGGIVGMLSNLSDTHVKYLVEPNGGIIGATWTRFELWVRNWAGAFGTWFTGYWEQQFSDAGTTIHGWLDDGQKIWQIFENFGGWVKTKATDIGKSIGSGLGDAFKTAINEAFIKVLNDVLSHFGDFVNFIGGGINDLAGKLHVTGVHVDTWQIPTIPLLAVGTENWPGGMAIVGDAGREIGIVDGVAKLFDKPMMVDLPPGSIVKNHGDTERILQNTASQSSRIGGTANDLAGGIARAGSTGNYALSGTGGIFDALGNAKDSAISGVKSLAGSALSGVQSLIGKGLGAAIDTIMSGAGVPDVTLGGVNFGDGIAATVKDLLGQGLKDMWDAVTANLPHPITGGRHGGALGTALLPLLPYINAAADNYGIPADIIGAIILHESGGNIGQVEIGGGLGRGLMQVDGGTWPQAFDPRMTGTSLDDAAYQIDVGSMILQRAFAASGGDVIQALRNYSGAGFDAVHGKSFYQELQDMGDISAADAALAGLIKDTTPGSSWASSNAVVQQAIDRLGDVSSGGLTDDGEWSGWCERFVEFMNQYAGTGLNSGTFPTAAAHMNASMTSSDTNPPAGASVFFYGSGWGGAAGHVGIATDHNSVISTTGLIGAHTPIAENNWIGVSGYQGYAPPGMKNGGVFSTPTIITTGDIPGRVPEITAPQPMMKATVMDALQQVLGGGGGVTVNFNENSIVAAQGMSTEDVARAVSERIRRNMRGMGKQG